MSIRIHTTLFVSVCLASVVHANTRGATVSADYARLPLVFEENRGQTDASVKFLARSQGYRVFVTSNELVMVAQRGAPQSVAPSPQAALPATRKVKPETDVVRLEFVGARTDAVAEGVEKLPGVTNYVVGTDRSKWRTNISNYASVRVRDVYRGIDLVVYGNGTELEYDFDVHAGADPSQIRMRAAGAKRVSVDRKTGDLLVESAGGTLRQRLPQVYQETADGRNKIEARYHVGRDGVVAFHLGRYERGERLVIDPVLVYSTYLGGSATDYGEGISIDDAGNMYVVSGTFSVDYPTSSPMQPANGGGRDAVISKLNPSGTALIYSTYLGGTGDDYPFGIGIDGSGNAYVIGTTKSVDFPTLSPLQSALAGPSDVFVTKLDATGALVYSTYLGGTTDDYGYQIGVDAARNAHIAGSTSSTDFPTVSALQPAKSGGTWDAFVATLNADASALTYSTYLGGTADDFAKGIAADAGGSVYVTGYTQSTDFPTAAPLQAANGGSDDAFITKLDASGTPVYSTYLGGIGNDRGSGIAVDSAGNAYVTGEMYSADFPLVAPFETYRGEGDAFVTKVDATGSSLVYSTALGALAWDSGYGITVDAAGNAYVTGLTYSHDFPTVSPLQRPVYEDWSPCHAFVTKISATDASLVYSTTLGRGSYNFGIGVAVGPSGDTYVVGQTREFPMVNSLQRTKVGTWDTYDAFVARISENGSSSSSDLTVQATTPATVIPGDTFTHTVTITNDGPDDATAVALIEDARSYALVSIAQTSGPAFSCATRPSVGDIQCSIDSFAVGASASFTFVHSVSTSVYWSQIGIGASASAMTPDPNETNDHVSSSISILPLAPSNLTASGASGPRVNLAWSDNSANETKFIIKRCPGASCTAWTKIATLDRDVTAYADTTVAGTTTYRYRVIAANMVGNSTASNIASATTPPPPPHAPSSLVVTGASSTSIRVAWLDNSTNETGFSIERCKGATCTSFARIATVGAGIRTYTNGLLARNTYYRYRVRAYNANGSSAPSNVATAKTLP